MGLKAPKLSLIIVAVVFALSCFGFTLFVWKSFGGSTPYEAHGYRFHIVFGTEASQMTSNADVRIAGVSVGKVIKVSRKGTGADVLVEVHREFAPIRKDTRAIVRFKSLLGEAFVSLTPGTKNSPEVPENGTLDRRNVAPVQQIDQVLGTFDATTRLAFTQFLRDSSKVLDKRAADINAALGNLAPTADSAADLLRTLDGERGSLQTLIRQSGVALRSIGSRANDLQTLVRAGNQVFGATAAQNKNLTETVKAFEPFLRETRAALRDIDGAAIDAAPTLRALRPAIPLIKPSLIEARRLAPELRKTFDETDPVITASRRGLPALTKILRTAQPALKVLRVASRELIPVSSYLTAYRTDAISAIARIAGAVNFPTTTTDGTTVRILRALFVINDESPTNASARLGANRHNAFPLPGSLLDVGKPGGLKALDCRNVNNAQTTPVLGQPSAPCQLAPKFSFRGQVQSYPHVRLKGSKKTR